MKTGSRRNIKPRYLHTRRGSLSLKPAHFQSRSFLSCLDKFCCSSREPQLVDRVRVRPMQTAGVAITVRVQAEDGRPTVFLLQQLPTAM